MNNEQPQNLNTAEDAKRPTHDGMTSGGVSRPNEQSEWLYFLVICED